MWVEVDFEEEEKWNSKNSGIENGGFLNDIPYGHQINWAKEYNSNLNSSSWQRFKINYVCHTLFISSTLTLIVTGPNSKSVNMYEFEKKIKYN